jgi:branched-chain amino acid transport system permease protein
MFEQQLVNGILLGSSYALIAVGYTLVFGVLKLFNLAHGEVFMLAGFIGVTLLSSGAPLALAVLGAMAGAALLSVLLERLCFRPIDLDANQIAPVLSTIGFGLMLQQLAVRVWGSQPEPVPTRIEGHDFNVGSVLISSEQLVSLGLALGLMVALALTIARSHVGRAMRAVSESVQVAELLGVDSRRVVALTFVASGLLAGLAGVLTTVTSGSASAFVGMDAGLNALAAIVVGGLGSFPGAFLGGMLLGLVQVMTVAYGSAAYGEAVVWGLLVAVLLVRPAGLFGRATAAGRL